MLEHAVIWDNGVVSAPFALSYEWRGGCLLFALEILTMMGEPSLFLNLTIATPSQLKFFDDGKFFDVATWPSSWQIGNIEGLNNDGRFVRSYSISNWK